MLLLPPLGLTTTSEAGSDRSDGDRHAWGNAKGELFVGEVLYYV